MVTNMEKSLVLGEYGKDRLVCILHGDCMDDALAVKRMVNDLGFERIVINDVSPSIGTHAGPGVVGLVYYGRKRE